MTDTPPPEADRIDGAPHPRETDRLFGQDEATAGFLQALADSRLHHAWLLTGPRGTGKATLAWKMAATLLADTNAGPGLFGDPEPPTLDLPADHPVRRRLLALSEPRFHLLRRPYDEKSGRLRTEIPVDEVRRMKSFFTLSAADGGRRVALIDAVDELNQNAANALLKLLEEPPKDVVLLLVSHQPAGLLPTIRSRCRTLRLSPLGPDDLAAALAQIGLDPGPEAPALSELAAGSVGRAVALLQNDGLKTYAEIVHLFERLPTLDRPAALKLAESTARRGAEARLSLLIELVELFLARLARAGASGPPAVQAAKGEQRLLEHLSPDPAAARRWADLHQALGARIRHGRAVNLDPAALILDMVLKITEEAGRALPN